MTDNDKWYQFASIITEELPEIDEALSQTNTPLSKRKMQALSLIMEHVIEVHGDRKAFFLSEVYARLMALVDDWYRERYGAALEAETDSFHSLVVIHALPFPFNVPLIFSKPGEEKETRWVGFPASVQEEESPLEWITEAPNIDNLTEHERDTLSEQAKRTANLIRSVNFDLKTLKSEEEEILRDLATSVLADLRSAAQNLCGRDDGLLRNAGWEISQAVEKTLKLYIRRNGGTPKQTHELKYLADNAEKLGSVKIDRSALALIPSGSRAANLRYGGNFTIEEGLKAYRSALEIIQTLAFAVQVKTEFDFREGRLLLKKPPWFNYDTQSFLEAIKGIDKGDG